MEDRAPLDLLQEAFVNFNRASSELERHYRSLEERVRELTRQLAESLDERRRLGDLLCSVLESISAGVVVVEREGLIVAFNRAAERMTSFRREEVEGKPFGLLFPERWLREGRVLEERWGQKWIRVVPSPLKGEAARGWVLVLEDVTELKKWQQQAMRNEGLSAMGEVAAQVAHEIRNPLGVIKLFASLLRKEFDGDGRGEELLEHILIGVKEIEGVLGNLLLFVRPQAPVFRTIDLRAPLREVLSFVAPLLEENGIRMVERISRSPLEIEGDGELLKQVFYNVVLNAVQAMPEGGTLRVSTTRRRSRIKGQRMVEVVVADSGVGIPPEDLQRIFSPFFTTKERGTGLGLTVVHRIVEVHGGLVEVESEVGKGTTFRISIPLKGGSRRRR
ncbi:MAG: hypothetical protein DRG36_00215 [Deltaproteobacteria bacterium]|nr:MAG: hypothetical protein DRG36_00215 [Deltaproteobacteria bacterium]